MTSSPAIASRSFTLDDQREFARASGDFNPLAGLGALGSQVEAAE